ncbi:hypothetical protein [Billgrantia desiderata]|uniref:hypothetical protein n=1 Tax=Billgrantia desiderata TaxID=52021 RepID=UPI001F1BA585|nr:hypothetical protein [Halomonas desiderata]MCE8012896.1 hypothetical protein [Halomonas desiderata]
MAVEIGTATDHVDLYNKLYQFLTGNAELVAAGQNWQRVWGNAPPYAADFAGAGQGSDIVLKGPGLAGLDEIYVGMRLEHDPAVDYFGIWFAGAQGIVPSATSFSAHVNSAPRMHMPVFDQTSPYWFVANGRRFVVVVKVSTTFVASYQGFFLPYATPSEYPYPMISSGCSRTARRWSDEAPSHTHFCMPGYIHRDGSTTYTYENYTTASYNGTVQVMSPSGEWVMFNNVNNEYRVFPWAQPAGGVDFVGNQRSLFGGGHMLYPATLLSTGSRLRGTLGVFEGVYHVSGFGNAAENILTLGGVDHLVVQNMFRTGFTDYWALALQ